MVNFVISHKNPDTDTICASIMFAKYLNLIGKEAKSIKLGDLNNETKYLLNKFEVLAPDTVLSLDEGSNIYLVDHNEVKQTIEGFDSLNLVGIVDHHKFKIETSNPLFIRAEPLGSTCTIISKMFFEKELDLTKEEASILIGAIISDTLYFRSPTSTLEDRDIVLKLNEIANISDLEAFSLELFDAKSDLGEISAKDMIKIDYKEFDFGVKKFGIGLMETTNPQYALVRKVEIEQAIKEIKSEEGLDGVIFCVIDILKERNIAFVVDEFERDVVKAAFNATIDDILADMGSILSRKKEIVPVLENYFK